MKNISRKQEQLLIKFEKFIELGYRDIPFFCTEHDTTPRKISHILIPIYNITLQDFMSKYSNHLCEHPCCINFTKYKVTGHKYDLFCSLDCRYKVTNSTGRIEVTLDQQVFMVKEMVENVKESKILSPKNKRDFLELPHMEIGMIKATYGNLHQTIQKGL